MSNYYLFYYLLIILKPLESRLYVCIGVIFNCQTVRCKILNQNSLKRKIGHRVIR